MPERIPVVWSDFVFAAFAEEVGFAGALGLLALSLVFVFRGMPIALRAPTPFLQLLAAGLSFIVALQALVIVGGNAKLIPLTGVTRPLLPSRRSAPGPELRHRRAPPSRERHQRPYPWVMPSPPIGLNIRRLTLLIALAFLATSVGVGYWTLHVAGLQ